MIEAAIISARVRTWNVLYASNDLVPKPPFGAVREVEIKQLWKWSGEPWGGAVKDSADELD